MKAASHLLRIGTRGSALALAQAEMTEAALRGEHPDLELERVVIKTTGDRRTDVPLGEVAKTEGHLDKGVFIKELEVALAGGEIDLAVHSLKDVPSELDEQFVIAAVLPRAPVGDVLVSKEEGGLAAMRAGAVVATSSVRRQRQLQWLRPDLRVADIRGNVPTRLRKLAEQDELDGILLAEAGLRRLGMLNGSRIVAGGHPLWAEVLDSAEFLPAAGQGAVALESRRDDSATAALLSPVNHEETLHAVTVERAFLAGLGAGCETPVGVLTRLRDGRLQVRARVFEDGETDPLEGEAEGPAHESAALARSLIDSLSRII